MTYDDSGDTTPGNTQRRELAREKSKSLRIQHKKKERRNRFLLQGGILVVLLAIIAIVTLSIVNTIRPAGPGPLNMASDGIQIGKGLAATQTAGLAPNSEPEPNERVEGSEVIAIQVYLDYLCAVCADFQQNNDDQIQTWLDSGAATIEYHPIALLNSHSAGSQYSTRSANAAACVANYSSSEFYAFNNALFTDQPADATEGLTDAELFDRATASGIANPDSIERCINELGFKGWVKDATDRALSEPIPGSNVERLTITPTVIVNGVKYEGDPSDAAAFSAFVVQAAGEAFTDDATATPAPTETPVAP